MKSGQEKPWTAATKWSPKVGTLDLWRVKLNSTGGYTGALDELSGEESARAQRLLVAGKRRQFVVTRAATRRILSAVVGCEPLDLEFEVGEHGKLFLPRGPVFNVSHSGNVALVAVVDGVPLDLECFPAGSAGRIGVDVEEVRSNRPLDRIARRFFASQENHAYLELPKPKRVEDFYRRWALKEAYVKALGTGLTYSSRAFWQRDDEPSWTPRRLMAECRRFGPCREAWHFSNGWLNQDGVRYAAAVCADRPLQLRFFSFAERY